MRSARISTPFTPVVTKCDPISCRSRSTCAPVWRRGTRSFSIPAASSPIPRNRPSGIAAPISCRGPAHCGACHTPKNLLGGDEQSAALQGGEVQGWFAPDITADPASGLGQWSVEDIVAYLKTGHNAAAGATGPMAEEIGFSSARMTDADLRAIAIYLKSLDEVRAAPPAPLAATDPQMKAGASIFSAQCSACHGSDGKGTPGLFPALAVSLPPHAKDPTSLIRVTLEGARTVSTAQEPTGPGMPSFGWKLSDAQVAAVLTYARNSWGLAAPAVTADEVAKARIRSQGARAVSGRTGAAAEAISAARDRSTWGRENCGATFPSLRRHGSAHRACRARGLAGAADRRRLCD